MTYTCVVAQYNVLLITQWPLDHTKISVLPGNETRAGDDGLATLRG